MYLSPKVIVYTACNTCKECIGCVNVCDMSYIYVLLPYIVYLVYINSHVSPIYDTFRSKYRGIYRNKWHIKWYMYYKNTITVIDMSTKIGFAVYYDHICCIK